MKISNRQLMEFTLGEVNSLERQQIESALVGDKSLLREYFSLKADVDFSHQNPTSLSFVSTLGLFMDVAIKLCRRRLFLLWLVPVASALLLLWVASGSFQETKGRLVDGDLPIERQIY